MIKKIFKNNYLRFIKFVKVGIFMTILSMLLSYYFLKILGTPLISTYVILFISMILLSFFLNSEYTFNSQRSSTKLFLYYGSYGITMLLGIALLSLFRTITSLENWILSYLVLPFTMISNYILSSFVFGKNDK